ncbi:MAG: SHOCT domain-containing protein [Chloroflexota bacterium]
MRPLTPQGQQAVNNIAARYNLSTNAVTSMLEAVVNGGGTMAQFNIPEVGGSGQWMKGGMTMVGDMFNYSLQGTVNNLCNELSNLLSSQNIFVDPPPVSDTPSSNFAGRGNWWPTEFGAPTASGSQNNVRYAYFGNINRLVLDYAGGVSVYDTLGHQISGVSQQQGSGSSVQFTSQYGIIDTLNLPLISGPGTLRQASAQPQPSQPSPQTKQSALPKSDSTDTPEAADEILTTIAQMAELHKKSILTDEEFNAKKAELLSRL